VTEGEFRFRTRVRVRFAETDAQGVVYHGNFLLYFEVARIEYARLLLGGPSTRQRDWEPTVAHVEVDFKAGARFDDELDVAMRASRLGRTSYSFVYQVRRGEELIATGATTQVVLDRATKKPRPLPEELVDAIVAYEPRPPER
jgi:acyl-CoA thioester hydrolase